VSLGISLTALFLLAAGMSAAWWYWNSQKSSPDRAATLDVLQRLDVSLKDANGDPADWIMPPTVAEGKSPAEYDRWIREVLYEEISPEGLAVLKEEARFGPLLDLFPEQAEAWTSPYSIPAAECLAFRMERSGITAEVVVAPYKGSYKIIRCNNIKQMALLPKS
jgi:hypothetical protein